MAKNGSTYGKKLLAIAFAAALLPIAMISTQAYAQQASSDEDEPHTSVTGTMEITTEVMDDHVHTTYIFTSEALKKKFGSSTILRVVEHPVHEGVNAQANEKKIEKNAKLKLVHESDISKVERYQQKKNEGIPMFMYTKWDVVEPVKDDSTVMNAITNPFLSFLRFIGILQTAEATHVEGWAHKSAAFSPYDPINIIWADTQNASLEVLGAAGSRLNGNGWTSVSNCLYSTDLYVLVGGTYVKQNAHHYKYGFGNCDGYHVRAWRINADIAIGAAHQEVVDPTTGDIRHIAPLWNYWENSVFFGHRVTSFENGETEVRNTFTGASGPTCWTTSANSHQMSNSYTREYWNDPRTVHIGTATNNGYATTINQINC